MLEVKNMKITIQDKTIIENLSFSIKKGDKLAIIGEEGNGKSTLMKVMYDESLVEKYAKVEGKVEGRSHVTIGYLEQFLNQDWLNQTMEMYFVKGEPKGEIDYEKYAQFYQLEEIFRNLGLDPKYLEEGRSIRTLSGGEKVKLQMAKILFKKPDLFLLDEPTNDIDIDTLEWLQSFILELSEPIVYISHDEVLLENTANGILHLEQIHHKTKPRHTLEHIRYQEYIRKRMGLLEKQEQMAVNEKREKEKQVDKFNCICQSVEYKQDTITRQDPSKGRLLKKKMKNVKSMEKRIVDKEITKRPEVEEQILLKFHNKDEIHQAKIILELHLPVLQIGDRLLKENVDIQVIGKEKVAIVGKNGTGKTTLLKVIYEALKTRKDLNVGYMPQDYEEGIEQEKTVVEFLKKEGTKEEETMARTYLASMKFTQEEILRNYTIFKWRTKSKDIFG